MAPFTPDQLVDRRRMQRRISVWRAIAFVALAAVVLVAGWRWTGTRGVAGTLVPHVARVQVGGLITGDRDTIKLIDDIAASHASGVLVMIDSPGGTTAGSERIYDALRRLSVKKPTVAVVGTLAASGGYIAAIGTDHIVAQKTSLVGSIGVLFQYPNVANALDKIGVKVETIKSSPLKASPNGYEPTSPEARAAIDALVVDSYGWFKDLVKARRKLDDQGLAAVADGRVFTGRQSVGLHLVDAVGEERDALKYLQDERGVAKTLPVLDWKKPSSFTGWKLFSVAGGVASLFGFDRVADAIGASARLADVRLSEGLLSVWEVR